MTAAPIPLTDDSPWEDLPRRPWRVEAAKRALDIVGAGVVLVVVAPVLAVAMAAIRLTSRGPAIFRQQRVGRHEQPFTILKLRTMTVDNDDSAHRAYAIALLTDPGAGPDGEDGTYKLTNDPRVTRVGAFLRRFSLDELPQLVNVLRGDMSLVGPRPALAWEVEHYRDEHRARAAVRPGCTGLWQVSGRSRLTTLQMLDLDADYAATWSVTGDIAILAKTPVVLLTGGGAR
jgi:lipopolysaccharide/colanic/teichoic acid biosynthesis glycosyltransferase